jgi:hypothetical protein
MKYFKIAALILLPVALFAFNAQYSGAIQGTVLPLEGIAQVMVISGTDTINVPNNNGSFLLKNLPAKTYTVMVKALPPFLDYTLNEVAVIDGTTTDIGKIQLQKE